MTLALVVLICQIFAQFFWYREKAKCEGQDWEQAVVD